MKRTISPPIKSLSKLFPLISMIRVILGSLIMSFNWTYISHTGIPKLKAQIIRIGNREVIILNDFHESDGRQENEPISSIDESPRSALAAFPLIRFGFSPLLDTISEDDVLNAQSWSDVLAPDTLEDITAEHVYRRILGIRGELYTERQVKDAYKALAVNWLPNKVSIENASFADLLFALLNKAQIGLLEAIEEKPELQEYAQKMKEYKIEEVD